MAPADYAELALPQAELETTMKWLATRGMTMPSPSLVRECHSRLFKPRSPRTEDVDRFAAVPTDAELDAALALFVGTDDPAGPEWSTPTIRLVGGVDVGQLEELARTDSEVGRLACTLLVLRAEIERQRRLLASRARGGLAPPSLVTLVGPTGLR